MIGIGRLHSCAQACWFVNISLLNLWMHSSQMAIPSNTSLEKMVATVFLFLIVFLHFFIYFFFCVGHKWPFRPIRPSKTTFLTFPYFFDFSASCFAFFSDVSAILLVFDWCIFLFFLFLADFWADMSDDAWAKNDDPSQHFFCFWIYISCIFWFLVLPVFEDVSANSLDFGNLPVFLSHFLTTSGH